MNTVFEKRYGLPTAIAMVIGIVIGSGIFFKTESVLSVTGGNAFTGVLSLAIMGLIMFFCAYAFSILSQKYDKVNGLVAFAEATCGEKYAYYLAWFMTFIYTPAITGCLAWVTAYYFGKIMGWEMASGQVIMIGSFLLVLDSFLNNIAPKLSGRLQVGSTVIKLIPLILMAVIGIAKGLITGQTVTNFALPASSSVSAAGGLTASVVALAFAFEGWILATSINAELKNAKRNMPLALIFGAIVIVAVYIFYYVGILGTIPMDELMANGSTQAFINTFGSGFGSILMIFIVISCYGTMHGLNMACGRNMYAIGSRNKGPAPVLYGHVDKETNMPVNSGFIGVVLGVFWMLFYVGSNFYGWFGLFAHDSSELPIVCLYALYIPIFLAMMKMDDLPKFQRYVVPVIAILCCLFLVGCAIYSHGYVKYVQAAANGEFSCPVLFFLIITAVVFLVGSLFYNKRSLLNLKDNQLE